MRECERIHDVNYFTKLGRRTRCRSYPFEKIELVGWGKTLLLI